MPLDKNGEVLPKAEPETVDGMVCELCGGKVVKKNGRYGDFYACADYPRCKFTKPITKDTGVPCPKCGAKIVIKRGKKKEFYSCEKYPECDFSVWDSPTEERCPLCSGMLLQRKSGKRYCSNKECNYKDTGKTGENQ